MIGVGSTSISISILVSSAFVLFPIHSIHSLARGSSFAHWQTGKRIFSDSKPWRLSYRGARPPLYGPLEGMGQGEWDEDLSRPVADVGVTLVKEAVLWGLVLLGWQLRSSHRFSVVTTTVCPTRQCCPCRT